MPRILSSILGALCISLIILTSGTAAEMTFVANDNAHVGNIGKEKEASAGNKASRGKIKGPEEFVLVNFDLSKIKGMTVKKARLQFYDAGAILYKVGFSSVASPWTGGNSSSFSDKNMALLGSALMFRNIGLG